MSRLAVCVLTVGVLALSQADPLAAQSRRSGESARRAQDADFESVNISYNGRFTFVRLRFEPLSDYGGRGWGGRDLKWDHDYPRAERHLTKILDQITAIGPNFDGSVILSVDDPELFKHPVAYLSEPGFWTLTAAEAARLRDYLLKGGFLIFDDFASRHWFNFEDRMLEVLPDARIVELDATHPIFHSFFEIDALDHTHPLCLSFSPSQRGLALPVRLPASHPLEVHLLRVDRLQIADAAADQLDAVWLQGSCQPLAERARGTLTTLGYTNVSVHRADGTLGWPADAPYDGILVSAAAPGVPQPLRDQLVDGGRLVIPVGTSPDSQALLRITRLCGGKFRQEDLGGVRFVPLVGARGWPGEDTDSGPQTLKPETEYTDEIISRINILLYAVSCRAHGKSYTKLSELSVEIFPE